MRPTKDEYFFQIAKVVASRSTCIRRKYGAVIVKDNQIISTGYNGSASGLQNCCDTGICSREMFNVPHGERYELCEAVHAEMNAIIQAGRLAKDSDLYLVGLENEAEINAEPCSLCKRVIINAGIKNVHVKKFM